MKFFSLSRERIPLIATIIFVALLAGFYYLKYLPDSRVELVAWKFRTLQNISQNIRTKIEISEKQLKTYLESKQVTKRTLTKSRLKVLNKALEDQNTVIFPISKIEPSPLAKNQVFEKLDKLSGRLEIERTSEIKGKCYSLKLEHDFKRFIAPLLSRDIFEQYIITDTSAILYETFQSGYIPAMDSTFRGEKPLNSSGIVTKTIAGNEYYVFVQPLTLTKADRIYIFGLLRVDDFNHSLAKLPSRVVLFLIALFAIILISFPIIKIVQLRSGDELTLSDALSLCIVCGLMVSMLFLIFVKYSSDFHDGINQPKMTIAEEISKRFVDEIRDNYITMQSIACEMACLKNLSTYSIKSESIKHIHLDRVFWMDTSGTEIWQLGGQKSESLKFYGTFKDRAYFQNIKNRTGYRMKGLCGQFYVEPVVSLITGQFLTDISVPSDIVIGGTRTAVMAMSFRLQSIDSLKLLPGYQFALIDRTGKVLYHSKPSRNLNENLIDEFSNSKELHSGIANGASEPFYTKYSGNEYSVQLRAVGEGLPFYAVVMEDISFNSFRDINVFGFTISMQAIVFLTVVVQFILIFLAAAKRSSVKGRPYDVDWLGPKLSSNREYLCSILFNMWVFATLCFFECPTMLCRIFILFIGILSVPVFLNLLFVFKYWGEKVPSTWYMKKAGAVGSLPIFAVGLVACNMLENTFYRVIDFFAYGILLPAITILLVRELLYARLLSNLVNRNLGKFAFHVSYAGVLISWMLLAMGLPVFLFFKSAFIYDHHLIAKYKHVQLARQGVAKFRNPRTDIQTDSTIQHVDVYLDSSWLLEAALVLDVDRTDSIRVHPDNHKFNMLLNALHMYGGGSSQVQLSQNETPVNDLTFFFGSRGRYYGPEITYMEAGANNFLRLTSSHLYLALPDIRTWYGFIPWCAFVVLLILFSWGFSFLIGKIFSVRPVSAVARRVGRGAANVISGRLFVIKADTAVDFKIQPLKYVQGVKGQKEPIIVDLKNIPDKSDEKSVEGWNAYLKSLSLEQGNHIALINFEYMLSDIEMSKIKLDLIKTILCNSSWQLTVVSAVHPDRIFDSMTNSRDEELITRIASWRSLFSGFTIATVRVNRLMYVSSGSTDTLVGASEHYYTYMSIWQYLSNGEKFFLYDLAEDGLVNSADEDTMLTLMRKGLICRHDGRLRLFSPEFKYFIVNQLKESELDLIIAQINDQRNWNRIRIPLSTLALAIVAFVLSSQQEASTKLITSLGALAAVIPTIINFLATLGGISTPRKAG